MRHTIFLGFQIQRVAGLAFALILLIAHTISAADGAGRDAFILVIAYVAGYADAGVGRCANAIRAVVEADWIAA